jgi:hypothetical protein
LPPRQKKHAHERFIELSEIGESPLDDGTVRVELQTTGGVIVCRVYPVEAGHAAVLWICGEQGWGGPAHGLYGRVARRLVQDRILSVELACRRPHDLLQCLLDTMMGAGYLDALERKRVVLVGHGLCGAVAISAAAQSPNIVAVAALGAQTVGACAVADLAGRSLLLLHGDGDSVTPAAGARELFGVAAEPKKMVVYAGCGHEFAECAEDVERDLSGWIREEMSLRVDPS